MRKLFVLALWIGILRAATPQVHPGVERWTVKTSVPAGTNFSKPTKIPLADLTGMADAPAVSKNDKRYQSARIRQVRRQV